MKTGHSMDTKDKVSPLRRLIPSKPATELSDLQSMKQGQPSGKQGADRVLEQWPVIPIVEQQAGSHVSSNQIPTGSRVVMLPVLVAAHEDQPDGLYGREGSEQIESASASDQGGIQASVGLLGAANGFRPERSRYVYGALMMDISRHEVLIHGREVGLTRKEFNLLECLLKRPGHVRSRDALLNAVWGYDYYGTARTVDVHIRRLKQKLPLLDRAIVCVRGLGYKLKDTRDEEADIHGVRRSG